MTADRSPTFLREAQDRLREQLMAGEAVTCPCCTQLCKVYKRSIHAAMARALILMHRASTPEPGWLHLPTVLGINGGDTAKLVYWDLIEQWDGERDDGSKRTGWWRVTGDGQAFVMGRAKVMKYAHVYDGRVLRMDGEWVGIRDCLGDKFDYNELMNR